MESSEFQRHILNADGSIDYDAFDRIWPNLRVLARCTPLDKYTIVKGADTCSLNHLLLVLRGMCASERCTPS